MDEKATAPALKRSIGFTLLVFFGVGTMVGGGIYALIGKVAEKAGYFAPLSFLVSGFLMLLTALSYSELSSRYPFSAGEAYYVERAFERRWMTTLIGGLVILTGIVSAATLVIAIEGFIQDIIPLPSPVLILAISTLFGLIAAWGIGESLAIVAIITVFEVGALIYVCGINVPSLTLSFPLEGGLAFSDFSVLTGIFLGAFLAVYAYIGFEDMVNIAEEVKNVHTTLPRAILICLAITILLYVLVAWTAVSVVRPEELARSLTPLATVIEGEGPVAEWGLRIVSILTGINGGLVQIIMAARVAYGLANLGQLPKWVSDINPRTHTPLKATFWITVIIFILALFFPLVMLAEMTSGVILLVFLLVNLSLLVIKFRSKHMKTKGITVVPNVVPLFGTIACGIFLILRLLGV